MPSLTRETKPPDGIAPPTGLWPSRASGEPQYSNSRVHRAGPRRILRHHQRAIGPHGTRLRRFPQRAMPFTDAQFLDLFGAFNTTLWPALVALWLVSLAVATQLVRGRARSDVVWLLASVHCAWVPDAWVTSRLPSPQLVRSRATPRGIFRSPRRKLVHSRRGRSQASERAQISGLSTRPQRPSSCLLTQCQLPLAEARAEASPHRCPRERGREARSLRRPPCHWSSRALSWFRARTPMGVLARSWRPTTRRSPLR